MLDLQDAGSVVSTMESMGGPLSKPSQPHPPQEPKLLGPLAPASSEFRQVRFFPTPQIELIPTVREMDAAQCRELWYTSVDFEKFKDEGKMYAKETRLQGPSATLAVEQAYAVCQLLNFRCEDDEYRFLLNGNQNFQVLKQHAGGLCTWAQRKQTCRGLEHWTSKAFYTARVETKNEVRQAVVEAYGTKEGTSGIYKQSQAISRASRILARLFGLADSQFKTNPSKDQELSDQILKDYRRQKQTRKDHEANGKNGASASHEEQQKEEQTKLSPTPAPQVAVPSSRPSPMITRPRLMIPSWKMPSPRPSPSCGRPKLAMPSPVDGIPSRHYVRTTGMA